MQLLFAADFSPNRSTIASAVTLCLPRTTK
jgi:hypothetical protein